VSDSFLDYVRDQLAGLHGVRFRRMFGGHGIYRGASFFGILAEGRLYFKTSADTRRFYEERGMLPFRASAKQTLINYYEVPPDVLEDTEALREWAERSLSITAVTARRAVKKLEPRRKRPK
jgi:DNA transformation protein and related proteins